MFNVSVECNYTSKGGITLNLNYIGSVAERFMRFRSRLAETEGVAEDLFNAVSIYVPKSLAEGNLASESYDPTTVTADNYAVIAVTVDNYKDVLAEGGALLSQWLPVCWRDGIVLLLRQFPYIFSSFAIPMAGNCQDTSTNVDDCIGTRQHHTNGGNTFRQEALL